MVKKTGLGMYLYLQGLDISGDIGSIGAIRSSANPLDVTGIDKDSFERILGLRDGEISFNCYYNDALSTPVLKALPETDVLALVIQGTTAGSATWALTAKQVTYNWSRNADGSLVGSVQLLGAAGFPLESGNLLLAKTTHASATDATGIDGAAQSTVGAVGFLQHFSGSSGTIEYDIEDSSNSTNGIDGSWTNLLAFSDVVTPWAATAQRVEVAGTVERWVRASTNGTFTNASFAMALRRRYAGEYDAA